MPRPLLVLIVDDEPLIRWALAETLIRCGCEVVEAGDARAAVTALTDGRQFDVVVLDYHLPDVSDLRLLATTRQVSPASRVIMMTAFMTPEVAARASELGAYCVLPKPLELEKVASLVLETRSAPPPSSSARPT